jgi:hypothetical protein
MPAAKNGMLFPWAHLKVKYQRMTPAKPLKRKSKEDEDENASRKETPNQDASR